SFALVVLSTCGLFLLQAAPFLMAATIIVYAGAIIVTFLFVIMLAHQSGLSDADVRSREPLLACLAGFVLLGAVLYVLDTAYDTAGLDRLLARTGAVLEATSAAELKAAIPEDFFEAYHQEANKLGGRPDAAKSLIEAMGEAEDALRKSEAEFARTHDAFVKL